MVKGANASHTICREAQEVCVTAPHCGVIAAHVHKLSREKSLGGGEAQTNVTKCQTLLHILKQIYIQENIFTKRSLTYKRRYKSTSREAHKSQPAGKATSQIWVQAGSDTVNGSF